jgi:hypothetical protein
MGVLEESLSGLWKKIHLQSFLIQFGLFSSLWDLSCRFWTYILIGFLPFDVPVQTMILNCFDVIVVLGILMQMLHIGAEVNTYFLKQKLLLLRIKRYFLEIKTRYDVVMSKKSFNSDGLRLLVNKAKEMGLHKDEIKEHISEIIEFIDFDNELLDSDAQNVPLKLIGIA